MKRILKYPYHYICLCVGLAIGIGLLAIGTFFDQQISEAVYVNGGPGTRWFGIIFSGFSEQPAYNIAAICGISLVGLNITKKFNWKNLIFIIIGLLAAGAGLYYAFKSFQNIASTMKAYTGINIKTFVIILSIYFIAFIDVCLSFLIIHYNLKHPEKRRDFTRLCITIFFILGVEILVQTGLKYLASRPRPRYIYGFTDPIVEGDVFRNWWDWQPLAVLNTTGASDNLKSLPSGHSMTATTTAFILPLVYNFFSKKKTVLMSSIFFGIGLLWALTNAFGRVCAGAHWLSDTAFGITITIILAYLTYLVVSLIYSAIDKHRNKVALKQ